VPAAGDARKFAVEDMLSTALACGASEVGLGAEAVERALGAPILPASAKTAPDEGIEGGLLELEQEVLRESFDLARATFEEQLRTWRSSVDLDGFVSIGRRFERAGVGIAVAAWERLQPLPDAELEYVFRVSKAMGARAMATEASAGLARRLARFVARYEMSVGLTISNRTAPADSEPADLEGPLSIGLEIAGWPHGGRHSPVELVRRHRERITHVYLQDRTAGEGTPVRLGDGGAPVKEVLLAMRESRARFPAIVRIDYPIPDGSSIEAECVRALVYCRACLLS
jgi:hypothetical protein